MKKNLPITGKQKKFSDDLNILSTTNLKGTTTYVNDDFCEVAEFKPHELLDKNHNIVRHPDMPPAAFKDLWETLKQGKPWMGLVKNRTKNGDHYWVDAYVSPIKDKETTVEYQSVRFNADPEAINRAESLYTNLMEEKLPKKLRIPTVPLHLKMLLISVACFIPSVAIAFWSQNAAYVPVSAAISIFAAGGLFSWALRHLRQLNQKSKQVFDNKLMQYLYSGRTDEIGQLELAMKMRHSELRSVVGRVKDSSIQIDKLSSKSADLIDKASKGAVSQHGELQQLATAIEEMTASFNEVAQNCNQSSSKVEQALGEVAIGKEKSEQAIQTNSRLSDELDKSTDTIKELEENSQQIGSVLDVIKSIAEQTNLLALNAAIEAARAGEQGRGFAVVADEVRSLAQRTQSSTEEIESMITRLQKGAQDAVLQVEKSLELSELSSQEITDAGGTLSTIANSMHTISDNSLQIATATEEQSCVAEEINRNISHISEEATNTMEWSKDAKEAGEAMLEQTNRQRALVQEFLR